MNDCHARRLVDERSKIRKKRKDNDALIGTLEFKKSAAFDPDFKASDLDKAKEERNKLTIAQAEVEQRLSLGGIRLIDFPGGTTSWDRVEEPIRATI